MKPGIKFPLPALIAGVGLILAGRATAQTFTTLHNFTNSDGAIPEASLILSGTTLYGTTLSGGSSGNGTVFAVNTDGTGFTVLHSFTPVSAYPYTNSDGASPYAGLILSGNTLYGTASGGGSSGWGTVFAINTNGTGFTVLHSFTGGSDGGGPVAKLVLSGNTLYGTSEFGGSSSAGTIFKLNTDATGFTTLYSFACCTAGAPQERGLILSDSTLYGTTCEGGSWNNGTVFKLNTNGTGFTVLHSFTATTFPSPYGRYTNNDGALPVAGLVLAGNTLYGNAMAGGNSGDGTVFKVNTNGTGFTVLHSFAGGNDEDSPEGDLILSGNTLYGTVTDSGYSLQGTVFAVNTDGTGFSVLHSFTGGSDGNFPKGGLILSGGTLYGTTENGGSGGSGVVFSLSLPAPLELTIIPSGPYVILTWPTNAAGFTLQSTTNLVSSAVWTNVSPGPVIVNGQNAVTNPISGIEEFYRLSQ